MPEQSGVDLARAIRAIRPELPVIIATGYGKNAFEQLAKAENEFPILGKPFKLPELATLLRVHLTANPRLEPS